MTDDKRPPSKWDVAGAKEVLNNYNKPSENIDIGNVYYAATQLEAAYQELVDINQKLVNERDAAVEKAEAVLSYIRICNESYKKVLAAKSKRLVEAMEPLLKWAEANHEMPNYSEVILNARAALEFE